MEQKSLFKIKHRRSLSWHGHILGQEKISQRVMEGKISEKRGRVRSRITFTKQMYQCSLGDKKSSRRKTPV